MSVAPPIYIAPPVPEPHRFGLFSVSNIVEPGAETRWENGLEYEPLPCGEAGLLKYVCDTAGEPGYPISIATGVDLVEVQPFLVYGDYTCSPVGRTLDEARERAMWLLTLGEERAVETAVQTGDTFPGGAPTMGGATALTVNPVHLSVGIGIAEAYIGTEGNGLGVIHAPRILGGPISDKGLVTRQGQRLETLLGNYVAIGAGYSNVDPDGEPADEGTAWLYVTGRPTIYRSEPFITPDEDHFLDKGTNDVSIVAQRTYAAFWSCVTAAVQVLLPEDCPCANGE